MLPPACLSVHKERIGLSPWTPPLKAEWFHLSPACSTVAGVLSTGCNTFTPPPLCTSVDTASGCCGSFRGDLSLCSLIYDALLHPTQHSLAQSASRSTPSNSTQSSLLKRPHLILFSQAPCRPLERLDRVATFSLAQILREVKTRCVFPNQCIISA